MQYFSELREVPPLQLGAVPNLKEPALLGDLLSSLAQLGAQAILSESRPSVAANEKRVRVVQILRETFSNLSARLVVGGSFAKETDLPDDASDVDIVLLFENFSEENHGELFNTVETKLRALAHDDYVIRDLRRVCADGYTHDNFIGDVHVIPWRLSGEGRIRAKRHVWHLAGKMEFADSSNGAIDFCRFDILIGKEMAEGELQEKVLTMRNPRERAVWGASFVEEHVAFVNNQTQSVKDAILLLKWWKHQVLRVFEECICIPSFFLEILVVHIAAKLPSSSCEEATPYTYFIESMRLLSDFHSLHVLWSHGEVLRSGRLSICHQNPLVLDPINPTNNVARAVTHMDVVEKIAKQTHDMLSDTSSQAYAFKTPARSFQWKAALKSVAMAPEEESPRAPWEGFEDFVTADNCEAFGLNDYIFEKYGGMMGFSNWFDGDDYDDD